MVNRDVLLSATISNPSGGLVPPGKVTLDIHMTTSVTMWIDAAAAKARARGKVPSISLL